MRTHDLTLKYDGWAWLAGQVVGRTQEFKICAWGVRSLNIGWKGDDLKVRLYVVNELDEELVAECFCLIRTRDGIGVFVDRGRFFVTTCDTDLAMGEIGIHPGTPFWVEVLS